MSTTIGCPFCDWQGDPDYLDHHLSQPHKEPPMSESNKVSNAETLRVLGFVIGVLPLLIPLNVLLWRIALGG